MMFVNDSQRRAVFASLGRNTFSSRSTCVNSFAIDKRKSIEKLIKRLAPKILDDFDPQTFDFWAEYDDELSFEQNASAIEKKLEQMGSIKPQAEFIDSAAREHEADALMNAILMERGNLDFNDLMAKLYEDKGLKNAFRDKLTVAVLTGVLPEDDYIVSQFDNIDDTFHRRLSNIQRIKVSGLQSSLRKQLDDAEARRAAAEAAVVTLGIKEDVKEKKISDAIEAVVEGKKEELPNPEEKDYIKKLVDVTFKREKENVNESPIVIDYKPPIYEEYEIY